MTGLYLALPVSENLNFLGKNFRKFLAPDRAVAQNCQKGIS